MIINQQPHMIAMTQNGMVVAANGKDLGNYIRESESNGIQSMIIATEGDVCAGPNQEVELIRDFSLNPTSQI